jgi:hypothetical protein
MGVKIWQINSWTLTESDISLSVGELLHVMTVYSLKMYNMHLIQCQENECRDQEEGNTWNIMFFLNV